MSPQKEFKIASIVMLFLGIIDALLIAVEWFDANSPLAGGNAFLLTIFALICIIALAKLYLGVKGLQYCKGAGKGTLHITLSKIGVVLAGIAVVLSVIDMFSGAGTLQTLASDSTDLIVIHWYYGLAKKHLA